MHSRLVHIATSVVLAHVLVSALGAQNVKPAAKSIPLHLAAPGYQELLSGPTDSVHMRSGLVVLAPGKSVGKHSTEDHEEIVIVLSGRGQMVLTDGTKLDITPDSPAYSPPGTEHDVINTGSAVLRYIYVVSNARQKLGQEGGTMPHITGLGGVFFKAKDPKAMYAWYEQHLGIKPSPDGSGAMFHWRDFNDPDKTGVTVWSIFPETTKYFGTGGAPLMLNYRVDDLKGLLEKLKAEGLNVDPKVEEADYGKFGWITDPEGNRIELWEPPAQK